MFTERRGFVRHKVHGPAFASFDGVTGGMILDLSEQGLAMQAGAPLETDREVRLRLNLPDSEAPLETTGYIAWADALGRAGVRFSDLPQEARERLDHWLAVHDESPSRKAPKLSFDRAFGVIPPDKSSNTATNRRSVSLEADADEADDRPAASATVQYEFHSLGSDLNSALRQIGERARALLRGSGAAIALIDRAPVFSPGVPSRSANSKGMMCRASVGTGGPPLGTRVDFNSGFTGECVRTGKALRCDDAETDARVAADLCQRLGIRSIVAAPIRYQREVVGLVEVFSPHSFAFDEGDLAVLERLAQTALLLVSQAQMLKGS